MSSVWARRTIAGTCGLLILALTACARGTATAPVASGSSLYASCSSCHGAAAEGMQVFGAPRIAGMPQWYLASQITRFQSGLRGKHPDDVEGLRMRAMARQMLSDAEVQAVAAYVAGLPAATNAPTVIGADPAAGEALFAICSACHGQQGEGNETMSAPPLAGLDDWYVMRQIQKFRAGVRGTAPGDAIGPLMQGMALTVPDDQTDDIAAYVRALPR